MRNCKYRAAVTTAEGLPEQTTLAASGNSCLASGACSLRRRREEQVTLAEMVGWVPVPHDCESEADEAESEAVALPPVTLVARLERPVAARALCQSHRKRQHCLLLSHPELRYGAGSATEKEPPERANQSLALAAPLVQVPARLNGHQRD